MTGEYFDTFLKALEKAFPPDPEQLKEGIAKAQDRLIKEWMQSTPDSQKELKEK